LHSLQKLINVASAPRPALGPTQLAVQWVQGALFPRVKRVRDVTLTTNPRLVQRSRTNRSTPRLPISTFVGGPGTALLYIRGIRESVVAFPFPAK
jgi:hypothetical protein